MLTEFGDRVIDHLRTDSPADVVSGVTITATRVIATAPHPSQRRARGHDTATMSVSAANGIDTTARWASSGWIGIP